MYEWGDAESRAVVAVVHSAQHVRRHTFREYVWSNANVASDEKLLKLCADAVGLVED